MDRRLLLFLVFFIPAINPEFLNAQNSEMHFTEDDGLPGNIVMDVIKDNMGIIWVATNNGVAQYDGDKFIHINDHNGKPLLMSRALACVNDTIYAGSYKGGLAIIKNDSIRKIFHNKNSTSDRVRKLCYIDSYRLLLAGTENGLFICKDTVFIPVPIPVEQHVKKVITAIACQDSLIYFTVADYGLYRLFVNRKLPENSFALKISAYGSYPLLITQNRIITTQYTRIYSFDCTEPSIYSLRNIPDDNFFIWSLSTYKNREILLGGIGDERFRGGILIYNPEKNSFRPLINDENIQTVHSIFNDSTENIVWVARDNGLTAIFDSPFERTAVKGSNIIDIGFAADSLYVLTPEGIFLKKDDVVIPSISKERILSVIDTYFNKPFLITKPSLFDNKGFRELVSFEKSGDRLFVSTQRGAISIPDLKTYLPFAAGTFSLTGDRSAYSQVKYVPLRFFPSYKDSIEWIEPVGPAGKAQDVDEIFESEGVFYCRSSINGLYIIKNNIVFRLSDENSSIDNYLTGIDRDPDGNIWCSSGNGNLFETGISDSAFIKGKTDLLNTGLTGNTCRWIKFNGDYLYTGTNKGLSIIRRDKLRSVNPQTDYYYNEFNGFDFISAVSPVSDGKGKVFLHTAHEIVSVDTNFRHPGEKKLRVRNLNINGRSIPFARGSELTLTFNQKQVSFSFNAIKYPSSRNFRYRYKVNSDTWINGNEVLLQSLRPGRYEIEMEGLNSEDMSAIYDRLVFSVRPPFWRSIWFIILIIAALTLLFYTYLSFRIKRLNKQHEEKTKLVIQNSELQLRSLQIQMNPHFIFNALNAIQAFIMEKNTEDSLRYLNDLSGIIRTNLENATEEYILLSREIDFLKKYIHIEEMRFNNKLNVEFSENVSDRRVRLPPMLIQPLIENAIKHGVRNREGIGAIKISFSQAGDTLSVTVQDNGAGREFSKSAQHSSHQGLSLNIIKKRLDLLNEKYHTDKHSISFTDLDLNGVAAGTRVMISILARN